MMLRLLALCALLAAATAHAAPLAPRGACADLLARPRRFLIRLKPGAAFDAAEQLVSQLNAVAGPTAHIAIGADSGQPEFKVLVATLGGPDVQPDSPAVAAACAALAAVRATADDDAAARVWRGLLDQVAQHVETDATVSVARPLDVKDDDEGPQPQPQSRAKAAQDGPRLCVQSPAGNWALDRLDAPQRPLDNKYTHFCALQPVPRAGEATVYVLDTGINPEHVEFYPGQVMLGPTFAPGTRDARDEYGHGTFAASQVGGRTFGVCQSPDDPRSAVPLVAVRVLGADGTGTVANVLDGLAWVVREAGKDRGRAHVANLSLGTLRSSTVNDAVDTATRAGVVVVAAAGNEGIDACLTSPASAGDAITVGATTRDDRLASFSNGGRCVTLLAPGADVRAAWIGPKNDETKVASGTSFAAPLVAGAAVQLYWRGVVPVRAPAADVQRALLGESARGEVRIPTVFRVFVWSTPNQLLQVRV